MVDAVLELLFRVSVTRRAVRDQNNSKIKGGGKTHTGFCDADVLWRPLREKGYISL